MSGIEWIVQGRLVGGSAARGCMHESSAGSGVAGKCSQSGTAVQFCSRADTSSSLTCFVGWVGSLPAGPGRTTSSRSGRRPWRGRPAGSGGGGAPGGGRPPAGACGRGSAPGHPPLLGCCRASQNAAGCDRDGAHVGWSSPARPGQRSPIVLEAAGVLLAPECKSWRPRAASVCPSMRALLEGCQQRRERARSQQRAVDYRIGRPR